MIDGMMAGCFGVAVEPTGAGRSSGPAVAESR